MPEFRFIHAADIHLDSPLRGLQAYEGAPADEIREAVRKALGNMAELAIDQKVDFVLIAGDVYDGDWKDFSTGLHFASVVTKLQRAGIAVYTISGNHDAESNTTKSLPLPTNPDGSPVLLSNRKAETIRLKELEVAIHGRSFKTAKETDNLALQYPTAVSGWFNIGMLHTALTGVEGHEPYAPCTTADLLSKEYQYWALGHVHNRQHHHQPGETPIVFPGNIQGRHIRETGPKGCELVTVSTSGEVDIQFHALDVFLWEVCRIDATSAETVDDVLDSVSVQLQRLLDDADDRPLAVRIQISGATDVHAKLAAGQYEWKQQVRVTAMSVSDRIWVEKIRIHTTPARDISAETIDSGPVTELLQYFDELNDDESGLLELNQELDDLRKKLPDELGRGSDAVVPVDADQLRSILNEVRPLLLHRLQTQEVTQ